MKFRRFSRRLAGTAVTGIAALALTVGPAAGTASAAPAPFPGIPNPCDIAPILCGLAPDGPVVSTPESHAPVDVPQCEVVVACGGGPTGRAARDRAALPRRQAAGRMFWLIRNAFSGS
jgi:hypothetical protein